jgi:tetratricopeptide (TPR) repeat protein
VIRFWMALVILAGLLSGCAGFRPLYDSDFADADRLFREKKYPEAAACYQKIAKESSSSGRGADALFAEASVRAFYDNPHRDYALALQQFEEFLKRYPSDGRAREAQNWRAVLRVLVEQRKENERLTQSIEQLKKIDIRHEEKRRK